MTPLSDRVRALNRRARTVKAHGGVKVHEPNSATRAADLAAATDRISVRSARARLVQLAAKRGVRGTTKGRVCLDLAYGRHRVRVDTVARHFIGATGVWHPDAPAADRLLVNDAEPTAAEVSVLKRIQTGSIPLGELRDWLRG